MRTLIVLLALLAQPLGAQTVTILHFSDYHSHALPFYSEGRNDQGGIARAVAYMRGEKKAGALVFSGGDTINKGSPAWSDKYTCAEWPWLNGIVDAMAFGNHDADYGKAEFDLCRESLVYPILSANTSGFEPTAVFTRNGVRIGVFALSGRDFPQLVKTPGFTFTEPVEAARAAVRHLREVERVDAVVMIGHQDDDDDFAMARAVPGIDLIFGSHSHRKQELMQIPGTTTWFISPGQYLTYISRVQLEVASHKVTGVTGGLTRVDKSLPEDAKLAKRVREMQRELEKDPAYSALFTVIAKLPSPISVDQLGQRSVEMMRDLANADVGLSVASTFRQPLPSGAITMELLRAAMPYENEIVVAELPGAELEAMLSKAADIYVARPQTFEPSRVYKVATTDFVANVVDKEHFGGAKKTGLKVREELSKELGKTRKTMIKN